jgi:hypothetical protein
MNAAQDDIKLTILVVSMKTVPIEKQIVQKREETCPAPLFLTIPPVFPNLFASGHDSVICRAPPGRNINF